MFNTSSILGLGSKVSTKERSATQNEFFSLSFIKRASSVFLSTRESQEFESFVSADPVRSPKPVGKKLVTYNDESTDNGGQTKTKHVALYHYTFSSGESVDGPAFPQKVSGMATPNTKEAVVTLKKKPAPVFPPWSKPISKAKKAATTWNANLPNVAEETNSSTVETTRDLVTTCAVIAREIGKGDKSRELFGNLGYIEAKNITRWEEKCENWLNTEWEMFSSYDNKVIILDDWGIQQIPTKIKHNIPNNIQLKLGNEKMQGVKPTRIEARIEEIRDLVRIWAVIAQESGYGEKHLELLGSLAEINAKNATSWEEKFEQWASEVLTPLASLRNKQVDLDDWGIHQIPEKIKHNIPNNITLKLGNEEIQGMLDPFTESPTQDSQ